MSQFDTKKSRLLPFIGVVVLATAVAVILFGGTAGINGANIDQHLQRFADYMSKQAAAAGKEAKFTYGTPAIEGWGFTKHATVDNVTLDVAEKAAPDTTKWSFSTVKMLVIPDPANANGLAFIFPGPVNVTENGQPKTVITFPSPLKYVYSEMEENHARMIAHMVYLPSQITLAATGGETGRVVISYDENPLLREKIMPDSNQRDAVYEFHNVKLVTGDGAQFTAGSVASHFNEAPGKDNRLEEKYTLKVADFIMHNQDKASKAYSVSVNLTSHSDMPAVNPETAATAIPNTETAINEMLLATDDFKVGITGSISTASDDPLPFGGATIDIDNVPQFLASELMPEAARKSVADALQKISGQTAETLTHAAIPLKREKGGTLYVGNISFQTLAASVLTDMMQAAPPPAAAPQPPQAPAPAIPSPGDNAPAPKGDSDQHGEPAKPSM